MSAWYLIILGAPLVALAQTALGAFLTPPWSAIDPALILAVGLITGFRSRQALAVALLTGLVLDILLAAPPGANLLARVLAIALTALAFDRVFTNRSYPSFLALNALAWTMSRLIFTIIGLLVGWPGVIRLADGRWSSWLNWLAADLAVQLAAALILMLTIRQTRRLFLSRFRRAT